MADMALGDLMDSGPVNKQARMMRSMQSQAQQLRNLGFEPGEIDVLIRGQHGLLKPGDDEAFQDALRKLALVKRVQSIPGMTKALRGGMGGSPMDNGAAGALQGLGFGGGGFSGSLNDLMR